MGLQAQSSLQRRSAEEGKGTELNLRLIVHLRLLLTSIVVACFIVLFSVRQVPKKYTKGPHHHDEHDILNKDNMSDDAIKATDRRGDQTQVVNERRKKKLRSSTPSTTWVTVDDGLVEDDKEHTTPLLRDSCCLFHSLIPNECCILIFAFVTDHKGYGPPDRKISLVCRHWCDLRRSRYMPIGSLIIGCCSMEINPYEEEREEGFGLRPRWAGWAAGKGDNEKKDTRRWTRQRKKEEVEKDEEHDALVKKEREKKAIVNGLFRFIDKHYFGTRDNQVFIGFLSDVEEVLVEVSGFDGAYHSHIMTSQPVLEAVEDVVRRIKARGIRVADGSRIPEKEGGGGGRQDDLEVTVATIAVSDFRDSDSYFKYLRSDQQLSIASWEYVSRWVHRYNAIVLHIPDEIRDPSLDTGAWNGLSHVMDDNGSALHFLLSPYLDLIAQKDRHDVRVRSWVESRSVFTFDQECDFRVGHVVRALHVARSRIARAYFVTSFRQNIASLLFQSVDWVSRLSTHHAEMSESHRVRLNTILRKRLRSAPLVMFTKKLKRELDAWKCYPTGCRRDLRQNDSYCKRVTEGFPLANYQAWATLKNDVLRQCFLRCESVDAEIASSRSVEWVELAPLLISLAEMKTSTFEGWMILNAEKKIEFSGEGEGSHFAFCGLLDGVGGELDEGDKDEGEDQTVVDKGYLVDTNTTSQKERDEERGQGEGKRKGKEEQLETRWDGMDDVDTRMDPIYQSCKWLGDEERKKLKRTCTSVAAKEEEEETNAHMSAQTAHQPDEVRADSDEAPRKDHLPFAPNLDNMRVFECFIYLRRMVDEEVARTQLGRKEVIARLRGEFIELNSSQNLFQIE